MSSSPTFLWSPSVSNPPPPFPHGCCLQGLFGSSASHTLSLAASQGWPQGPDYATSTTSQPSQAGWGLTPNQRTPAPASWISDSSPTPSSRMKAMFSPAGQILDQMHRWREPRQRDVGKGKGRVGWEGRIWENEELNMGGLWDLKSPPQVCLHQGESPLCC